MLQCVFESNSVLPVFEEATGIRLEREGAREIGELRARFPGLPAIENYVSPKHASVRLGGHFLVRIYSDDDYPDDGVEDEGLERYRPERGPQEFQVSAKASRANLEAMFWGATSEITPEAQTTWALLISCLQRL
jgi:hypothetical protein